MILSGQGADALIVGTTKVVYNYKGTVFCHCSRTDEWREMAYGGFEKARGALKYRCLAMEVDNFM